MALTVAFARLIDNRAVHGTHGLIRDADDAARAVDVLVSTALDSTEPSRAILVIPELEVVCPTCKGRCSFFSEAWRRWIEAVEEAAREKTEAPPPPPGPEEVPCGECDGVGKVPSELGATLLRFLRRYLLEPQET